MSGYCYANRRFYFVAVLCHLWVTITRLTVILSDPLFRHWSHSFFMLCSNFWDRVELCFFLQAQLTCLSLVFRPEVEYVPYPSTLPKRLEAPVLCGEFARYKKQYNCCYFMICHNSITYVLLLYYPYIFIHV